MSVIAAKLMPIRSDTWRDTKPAVCRPLGQRMSTDRFRRGKEIVPEASRLNSNGPFADERCYGSAPTTVPWMLVTAGENVQSVRSSVEPDGTVSESTYRASAPAPLALSD